MLAGPDGVGPVDEEAWASLYEAARSSLNKDVAKQGCC
jgi:hypothetical protein